MTDHRSSMTWLCFVTFDDVPSYEAKGWKVHAKLGGNHQHFSILMIWEGEGEPT